MLGGDHYFVLYTHKVTCPRLTSVAPMDRGARVVFRDEHNITLAIGNSVSFHSWLVTWAFLGWSNPLMAGLIEIAFYTFSPFRHSLEARTDFSFCVCVWGKKHNEKKALHLHNPVRVKGQVLAYRRQSGGAVSLQRERFFSRAPKLLTRSSLTATFSLIDWSTSQTTSDIQSGYDCRVSNEAKWGFRTGQIWHGLTRTQSHTKGIKTGSLTESTFMRFTLHSHRSLLCSFTPKICPLPRQ